MWRCARPFDSIEFGSRSLVVFHLDRDRIVAGVGLESYLAQVGWAQVQGRVVGKAKALGGETKQRGVEVAVVVLIVKECDGVVAGLGEGEAEVGDRQRHGYGLPGQFVAPIQKMPGLVRID